MNLYCRAGRAGPLLTFLRSELQLSASLVQRLKRTDALTVNGLPVFTNHPVLPGDVISVCLDEPPPAFPPEAGPLEILWEDDALLAADKPPCLWTHPSASRQTGTLANLAAGYFRQRGQPCGIHPVTRLDRDTFGVVLLAKNAHIHALLCRAQQACRLEKTYLAAVAGGPEQDAGLISLPIGRRGGGSLLREVRADGQAARTRYRVLNRAAGVSLLELRPETGRTHQLRVHCAAMGFPILGDRGYSSPASLLLSRRWDLHTQQLCAARLRFAHPLTGEPLEIASHQAPFFPDSSDIFPFDG